MRGLARMVQAIAAAVALVYFLDQAEACILDDAKGKPHEDAVEAYKGGDYANAHVVFKRLAEEGNADAQNCLADMYNLGHGVTSDRAEAVRWWRKAAEGGNPSAQHLLFFFFLGGWDGFPKDEAEAFKWLRRAAEGGDAYSMTRLGDFSKQPKRSAGINAL